MLVLLTDTHLAPSGVEVHGMLPERRLSAAVPVVSESHPDAEAVLVMGDIAESGEEEAYRLFRRIAGGFDAPVYVMLGNHDDRAAARRALPDLADDGSGFVQFTLDVEGAHCVCLDTLDPGQVSGTLCERRLDWLDRSLAAAPGDVPVLLFQHHHPFRSGLECMDRIGLDNAEAEWEVLSNHDLPSMLFVGHVHRPVSGHWRGIPVHAQRGTNHQIGWDVGVRAGKRSIFTRERPEYSIVQVDRDSVIVLARDCEDDGLEIERA